MSNEKLFIIKPPENKYFFVANYPGNYLPAGRQGGEQNSKTKINT